MVQLRHERKSLANDYWKLDSGKGRTKKTKEGLLHILKLNDEHSKVKTLKRLRELYVRQQRGLLSYERFTARELKSFVVQRGLLLTATTKATVATLRAQLEQADEDATFDRFSDLPAELRQQIFKQYFDSFDDSREGMSEPGGQPPITLVSRQTRLEALPLYYSRCHFRLYTGGHGRHLPDSAFVSATPAHHFARIRFLNLSGFCCQYNLVIYKISISISLDDEECSTSVSEVAYDEDDDEYIDDIFDYNKNWKMAMDSVNDMLRQEPHSVIRRIAARPGWQKLRRSDMPELNYWLSSAVERAVSQTDSVCMFPAFT